MICEHVAGHATFYQVLRSVAETRSDLDAVWMPLGLDPERTLDRLPPWSRNWSVRASTTARRKARPFTGLLDAALVHTQTAALALGSFMQAVPTLISLDATPLGWDSVGADRGHKVASRPIEEAKKLVVTRALRSATGLIAWTDWVKRSLIDDYGISERRITVLPSGISLPVLEERKPHNGPVRLLFVGQDFAGKGGEDLLRALQGLSGWELDVVTHSSLPPMPNLRCHNGLSSTSPELAELYTRADVAVLPTRGDCSPFAILEAMSHALPVLSSDVGAIADMVEHATTGFLVRPKDTAAISEYLGLLISDPGLRLRLGQAGRQRAERQYDARRNANLLFDMLLETARRRGSPSRPQAG